MIWWCGDFCWRPVRLLLLRTVIAVGVAALAFAPVRAESPLRAYHPNCAHIGPASVLLLETRSESLGLACGVENPGGPATTLQSRFLIASVSKTYLAVALLQLQDQGVLKIDDAAAAWLPKDVVAQFGGLNGLTIAHLLTMRSGLPDYLDDTFYEKSLRQVSEGASPRDVLLGALNEISNEPHLFTPGSRFDYSNTNYLLAQLILEKAAGTQMQAVFHKTIFEPAGLKQTRLLGFGARPKDFVSGWDDMGAGLEQVGSDHAGYGMGDGGLISTAADVAAFYKALFGDRVLLSDQGLKDLLHDPLGEGYGMGIEIEADGKGAWIVGHPGGDVGFSADVRHNLGNGYTAVYLSARGDDDQALSWDVLDAVGDGELQ